MLRRLLPNPSRGTAPRGRVCPAEKQWNVRAGLGGGERLGRITGNDEQKLRGLFASETRMRGLAGGGLRKPAASRPDHRRREDGEEQMGERTGELHLARSSAAPGGVKPAGAGFWRRVYRTPRRASRMPPEMAVPKTPARFGPIAW